MKPIWVACFPLVLTACGNSVDEMKNETSIIELGLHVPIAELLKNSPIEFAKECMPNFDLCWYEITQSANSANLPGAVIRSAGDSLALARVTRITAVIDHRIGSSVENLTLTLRGLPDNSSHQHNIEFVSALSENIKASGWRRYYLTGNPRINGSQATKIQTANDVVGRYASNHPWLDFDYPIDIERWLQRRIYDWYFYNNGSYLKLLVRRNDSKDDPKNTGTYLITLNIRSEREFWLSGVTDRNDRLNWKALLPERLKSYVASRRALEDKARAAGIDIDETYEDPPIDVLE